MTSVDDLLNELNYLDGLRPQPIPLKGGEQVELASGGAVPAINLGADEAQVFACFRGGSILSRDALVGQTGLPVAQLSSTLMMLELKRLVVKRADGTFEARSSS